MFEITFLIISLITLAKCYPQEVSASFRCKSNKTSKFYIIFFQIQPPPDEQYDSSSDEQRDLLFVSIIRKIAAEMQQQQTSTTMTPAVESTSHHQRLDCGRVPTCGSICCKGGVFPWSETKFSRENLKMWEINV